MKFWLIASPFSAERQICFCLAGRGVDALTFPCTPPVGAETHLCAGATCCMQPFSFLLGFSEPAASVSPSDTLLHLSACILIGPSRAPSCGCLPLSYLLQTVFLGRLLNLILRIFERFPPLADPPAPSRPPADVNPVCACASGTPTFPQGVQSGPSPPPELWCSHLDRSGKHLLAGRHLNAASALSADAFQLFQRVGNKHVQLKGPFPRHFCHF